jgi:hypothetical protein
LPEQEYGPDKTPGLITFETSEDRSRGALFPEPTEVRQTIRLSSLRSALLQGRFRYRRCVIATGSAPVTVRPEWSPCATKVCG